MNEHRLSKANTQLLAERMGEAAVKFLAMLAPDQRRKVNFEFADEKERTFWHYTPIPRQGLPFKEMDRRQQRLAQQLVATGLSRAGYVAASTIMGLETTLDMIEGWERALPGRDSRLYYLSIFGTPDAKEPWGWQFEGHHISLNYTLAGGQIVSPTPTFFGANPAEAPLGAVGTLRPLAGEEDLARDLIQAMAEEQRRQTIIAAVAPADIVTTNAVQVVDGMMLVSAPEQLGHELSQALRYTSQPQGLAGQAMPPDQREILAALLGQYISRMPDDLAAIEAERLKPAYLDQLHFAWAGGLERGQPHYYRLQGPDLLVEYDNTQNEANHIHSVWRDPRNDFGAHLLDHHYSHSHKH